MIKGWLFFALAVLLLHMRAKANIETSFLGGNDSTAIMKPEKQERSFKRFIRSLTTVDTNYVTSNSYRSTVMMDGEKHFSFYRISGENENKKTQSLYLSPYSTWQVGPYVGYSILFLGVTIDVSTKQTSLNRSNLYLSLYTPLIGVDYYYQRGKDNYKIERVKGFDSEADNAVKNVSLPGMSTYLQSLFVYYIFNHKKFSYPAAYSQTTQQKRSCGSLMIGFNYTRQKLNFDYTQLPDLLLYDNNGNEKIYDGLKVNSISYRDYSIGIGYSYNWAFARNCLFNITLTPTIGYNVNNGEKLELSTKLFSTKQLNFDFITRSALVWNTGKYYVGGTFTGHTYSYHKSSFSILNALMSLQVYAGLNFWLKKSAKNRK